MSTSIIPVGILEKRLEDVTRGLGASIAGRSDTALNTVWAAVRSPDLNPDAVEFMTEFALVTAEFMAEFTTEPTLEFKAELIVVVALVTAEFTTEFMAEVTVEPILATLDETFPTPSKILLNIPDIFICPRK